MYEGSLPQGLSEARRGHKGSSDTSLVLIRREHHLGYDNHHKGDAGILLENGRRQGEVKKEGGSRGSPSQPFQDKKRTVNDFYTLAGFVVFRSINEEYLR
jgi:hypothetical protein